MKSIYPLEAALLFLLSGFFTNAQPYNAIHSGAWSNIQTWDASGVPAANCKTCTITIDAGVTVTLDVSVVNLTNTSELIVGTGSNPSSGLILNGNTLNVKTGSTVTIANSVSFIDATSVGSSLNYYNGSGMTGPLLNPSSSYTFNCGGSTGNSCSLGVVYGSAYSTTGNSAKNVTFLSSITSLPVELSGFVATLNANKTVSLSWATEQEINSSLFYIEKSNDGTNWQSIGSVDAKGNSSMVTDYAFADQTPVNGIAYYRLQMVDLDGKYTYSSVEVVRNSLVSGVNVFPNPTKDYVNISLNGSAGTEVLVRLINQNGQVLKQQKINAESATTVSLAVHGYPKGVYFLQISGATGTDSQTTKLIVTL